MEAGSPSLDALLLRLWHLSFSMALLSFFPLNLGQVAEIVRMLAIQNRKNCGTKQGTWKDQRLAQKDLFRQARNEVSGTKRFLFIRSPVIKSLHRSPRLPIIYILTKHCLVDSPQSPVNEWEAALCWLKTPTLFFSMAAPSWMKGWDNTSLGRAGGGCLITNLQESQTPAEGCGNTILS